MSSVELIRNLAGEKSEARRRYLEARQAGVEPDTADREVLQLFGEDVAGLDVQAEAKKWDAKDIELAAAGKQIETDIAVPAREAAASLAGDFEAFLPLLSAVVQKVVAGARADAESARRYADAVGDVAHRLQTSPYSAWWRSRAGRHAAMNAEQRSSRQAIGHAPDEQSRRMLIEQDRLRRAEIDHCPDAPSTTPPAPYVARELRTVVIEAVAQAVRLAFPDQEQRAELAEAFRVELST